MDAVKAVSAKFQSDVDNLAKELITAHALKFKQEVENLSSPLNRWLDFRYRFVDAQPRQVAFSDRFPKSGLSSAGRAGLNHFISLIQQGSDLNPYQGRGLRLRNDTSGNERDVRTDLLWADWGITHFHLTSEPLPVDQYFSRPADYLAFCLVGGDMVAFIDVLRHPDKQGFADPCLLETMYRSWPHYMRRFELKGALTQHHRPDTREDIQRFRIQGLNVLPTFDGKTYMSPGMGITSASTSSRVALAVVRTRRGIDALAKAVCDPGKPFQRHLSQQGVKQPSWTFGITPRGLAVYEAISSTAFLLPKAGPGENETFMSELQGVIAPNWAVAQFLKVFPPGDPAEFLTDNIDETQ